MAQGGFTLKLPQFSPRGLVLALSPGHTQPFQRMDEKSMRAWYQKSHDQRHDRIILHSQKVRFKLELL